MKLRARTDQSQPGIVAALRGVGAKVQSLHRVGSGCPDLLVSFRGRWHVMECKTGKGKLKIDQQDWIDTFTAPVDVVRTPDEALRAIGAMK